MSADTNNWPTGIKKTRQRQAVLAALQQAEQPLSALDLHMRAAAAGQGISLSTIYRILEYMEKKGVVTRAEVAGSESALYELNRFRHKHYAVCVNCRKIIKMDNCPMENFIPHIAEKDFRVTGHSVKIYGYCRECDGPEKIYF
ncbi:MAG: transcriptional repressor [Gracilibacteraceae bacterium]|jgi:Fur family ferric uptake transcriptional regulator|nr:transcriptional repressor [Gracilibacteraceae bacterium]